MRIEFTLKADFILMLLDHAYAATLLVGLIVIVACSSTQLFFVIYNHLELKQKHKLFMSATICVHVLTSNTDRDVLRYYLVSRIAADPEQLNIKI